jgi:predicted Zn-dependent peptidase
VVAVAGSRSRHGVAIRRRHRRRARQRGITLTITVARHLLSLVCTCLADDFEPVLGLLADIIAAPSIPESELAVRKGEVITAIRQDDDNTASARPKR